MDGKASDPAAGDGMAGEETVCEDGNSNDFYPKIWVQGRQDACQHDDEG